MIEKQESLYTNFTEKKVVPRRLMRAGVEYGSELDKLEPFLAQLEIEENAWSSKDPRIAACAQATAEEICEPTNGSFRRFITTNLIENIRLGIGASEPRTPDTPDNELNLPYKFNFWLRISHFNALSPVYSQKQRVLPNTPKVRLNPRFPNDFNDVDSWKRVNDVAMSDFLQMGAMQIILLTKDLTSNQPPRYATLPIVTRLIRNHMPDRLGDRVRVLDACSSQNLGLTKLGLKSPFTKIAVVDRDPDGIALPNVAATTIVNDYVKTGLELEDSWGVDRVKAGDPLEIRWANACSRYTSEFLDRRQSEDYEYLYKNQKNVANVNSEIWDVSDTEAMKKLPFPDGFFDLIFISTALYQMPPAMIPLVLRNLASLGKEQGFMIVQEGAEVNPKAKSLFDKVPFIFHANPFRSQFEYNAFIADLSVADPIPEKLIGYLNARCKVAELGSAAIRMMESVDDSARSS